MEVVLLFWLLFGFFSAALAAHRNRSAFGWFLIGVLFGPFGLLVALFPPLEKRQPTSLPGSAIARGPAQSSAGSTSAQLYESAHSLHYERRDIDAADVLYRRIVADYANTPEADYARSQLRNIEQMTPEQRQGLAERRAASEAQMTSPISPGLAQEAPSPLDTLSRLAQLRKEGAITEDEFAAKKAELLRQI